MIGDRERLERTFELFEMPEPALERLGRFRDRRRRRQRIGAGVAAALVWVLALGVVAGTLPDAHDPIRGGPRPTVTPVLDLGRWTGMWPQSTRADGREAQRLADAGNSDLEWQTDPRQEGLVAIRFATQELGWKGEIVGGIEYVERPGAPVEQAWDAEAVLWYLLRCGGPNPLYPTDVRGSRCGPTIDATAYEVIEVRGEQLVRRGPGGIWLITDWRSVRGDDLEIGVQAIPRSLEHAERILMRFLDARLAGSGAEQLFTCCESDADVDLLLYRTSGGSRYLRYDFNPMRGGPAWPDGEWYFRINLYARDGTVVTEWPYAVGPEGSPAEVAGCCYFQVRETVP
jgi:hypothetical protein